MSACLSGNPDAVDCSSGMIQLLPRLLEAAFDRPSAGGHLPTRGQDELHQLRDEWEEVVSSAMFSLAPAKRHTAWRGQFGRDFARVHRTVLHDRRAEEHGRFAVRVREWSLARLVDAREGLSRRAQGYSVSGRWHLLLLLMVRLRQRGCWGRVTWGRLVVLRNGE